MSDADTAWTLWYLALAACADVAYGADARDADEIARAEALHCRCLSDMAQVRRHNLKSIIAQVLLALPSALVHEGRSLN